MRGHWRPVLLAVIILACVGFAQTSQGHAVLATAGLYEEPATYTELAFTTPGALPSTLPTSNASVKVSFGIHNVSSGQRSYNWSIETVHLGVSQVKASGAVLTAAQAQAVVTRSVVPACTSGRVEIVVRLASPAESIIFWMTCPSALTKTHAGR